MIREPARLLLCLATAALPGPDALSGQAGERWNDERVLELVGRGRDLRHSLVVDTAFRSYEAAARGYVYFFIDRPDSDERTLVKADQIALEVYWQAPSRTGQRIVGLRDEKVLPTNIRYHLDHLTVVQDDFGDFIRLGDGDEVEQVLHPVGPGSEQVYDFLLSDSLTLTHSGGSAQVRVYEVRVRPKVWDAPGFIGSVYLDRATGAIVRMNFSFTPASYVDPYLDYIRISLDNLLWDGRYWLPYRQEAELRRELPALDFLAGSVIRGRFEIGPYQINREVPELVFTGRGVTAVPEAQREAFPFERGLYDDLVTEGLDPSPSLEQIRSEVRSMVADRYLSGLSPLRLHLGAASDLVRYDRAEGLFVGAGVSARPDGETLARGSFGYSEARGKVSGEIAVTADGGPVHPTLRLYWDRLEDIDRTGATPGLLNSLATVFGIEDYLDPYFARGVRIDFRGHDPTGTRVSLRWERHGSARHLVGGGLRPVRAVDEGLLGAVDARTTWAPPAGGELELRASLGRLESRTFATLETLGRWRVIDPEAGWRAELVAAGGAVTAEAPAQSLYLLGGRGTLPGHGYRSFVGDRFWLVSVEGTLPLRWPWLSARAFAAVGETRLDGRALPGGWDARDSAGARGSLGAGLAVGWDVLRLDLARGLGGGGGWELVFSVAPRLQAWL